MDLEIYGLRIFCQVIKDKTFSKAAKSLRITQPAVSQQIAKLEDKLQEKLFERVGHDVIPTTLAREFYIFALSLVESVDEYEAKLQNRRITPKGEVRYAMPESCQWTPHYRKIMSQIISVPAVNFKIDILPNELIVKGLIEGHFDFGFVVGERLAPELRFRKFSKESYSAVAKNKDFFKPFQNLEDLQELRLITYPGGDIFYETWANAQGIWKTSKKKLGKAAVEIGTLAGAIHAVLEGAGVCVLPSHCVAEALSRSRLFLGSFPSLPPQEPSRLLELCRNG